MIVETGSRWRHYNGIEYTVLHIANVAHFTPKHLIGIVYQGDNGNIWVKDVYDFLETMKPV